MEQNNQEKILEATKDKQTGHDDSVRNPVYKNESDLSRKENRLLEKEKLKGMGVSYCATCDGAFFRNKVTAVVGGGNVALEDAIFLSRMCKKVYLIHRRDEFRGAKILQDEVKKNDKIEILWNTIVTNIAVGTKPASELLSGKLSTDEKGYIIAGEDGVTNIPGIFAAGDGRSKNLRQVVTAVSDGANCVYSVERYLQNA